MDSYMSTQVNTSSWIWSSVFCFHDCKYNSFLSLYHTSIYLSSRLSPLLGLGFLYSTHTDLLIFSIHPVLLIPKFPKILFYVQFQVRVTLQPQGRRKSSAIDWPKRRNEELPQTKKENRRKKTEERKPKPKWVKKQSWRHLWHIRDLPCRSGLL